MLFLKSRNTGRLSKIIPGLLVGVFFRLLFEQLKHTKQLGDSKLPIKDTQNLDCLECQTVDTCPICEPSVITCDLPNDVKPSYKPKGMYEVTRWLYFDEQSVYDIINDSPQVILGGHWREEINAVKQVALEYINENQMMDSFWSKVTIKNGYMRNDVIRGTEYMLDLIATPLNMSYSLREKLFRIRLVHALEPIEKSKLLSLNRNFQGAVKIIMPVQTDSNTVEDFVGHFCQNLNKESLELILILFAGTSAQEIKDSNTLRSNLITLSEKCSKASVLILTHQGSYNYLEGIEMGITKVTIRNDLILALEDDVNFSSDLIQTCQSIAGKGKRAYLPIAFGQYDSDIITKGMPPGKPKDIKRTEHSKFTGYWLHEETRYICTFKNDLLKILSHHESTNNIKIGSWIYDRFLQSDMEVISAVDSDFYKKPYTKQCSKTLGNYKQCLESKAIQLGSKPALGILYITEVLQKH